MGRVIFLLEEQSMKELLEGLLPRIFPDLHFLCIVHDGKQDLDHSIRPKLLDWRVPGDRFVIVRDNDGGDCIALKRRLRELCQGTGHNDTLVRIVCQELETWYLGQPEALAEAFGNQNLRTIRSQPRFRNPDARPKPSIDIARLCPEFQKTSGARTMARHLTRDGNYSASFNVFMEGIARLLPHHDGNLAGVNPH
jgi:hypothetical protein